ncbi:unnamed protein product, partial [Iphiclides podalirius]
MEEKNKDTDDCKRQRRKRRIDIPRRAPSIVVPERTPVYITADKTTCLHCGCFPKEDPYVRNKKINPCQRSPSTLYEIAARVVDGLQLPAPFMWTVEDVADWISEEVGLPQYRECIVTNQVDGLRLLMLEDPSKLPEMNIHDFDHILTMTSSVRRNYSAEWVRFSRSVGLPRKPLTHCTWFKSRTGPSWGIRKNWTRCDVLRWMKIIMPEPLYLDHWDLVWYHKPEFPKVKIARVGATRPSPTIPHYDPRKETCNEYLAPRKFRLLTHLSESKQVIWMEIPKSPEQEAIEERKMEPKARHESNLMPKKICLKGLRGEELILARRKMPRAKFLP